MSRAKEKKDTKKKKKRRCGADRFRAKKQRLAEEERVADPQQRTIQYPQRNMHQPSNVKRAEKLGPGFVMRIKV